MDYNYNEALYIIHTRSQSIREHKHFANNSQYSDARAHSK